MRYPINQFCPNIHLAPTTERQASDAAMPNTAKPTTPSAALREVPEEVLPSTAVAEGDDPEVLADGDT